MVNVIEHEITYSNAKKSDTVIRIRESVKYKTPVCFAMMILPSQKNLFRPGNIWNK